MTSKEYDKLTDEEKRIKVAELCGWRKAPCGPGLRWWYPGSDKKPQLGSVPTSILPDYLNDLNACHKFEKLIPKDKTGAWMAHLCEACKEAREHTSRASAEQRCRAFVLTLTETA